MTVAPNTGSCSPNLWASSPNLAGGCEKAEAAPCGTASLLHQRLVGKLDTICAIPCPRSRLAAPETELAEHSIMEYTGGMTKRYQTVAEMVQAMDLPEAQKKRQLEYLEERQLSRALTVMRAQRRMTQKDAAEKLSWSQGRVSKLEMKADHDISIGDLADYAEAMGMQVAITFSPDKAAKPSITNLTQISMKLVGRSMALRNSDGRRAFRKTAQ